MKESVCDAHAREGDFKIYGVYQNVRLTDSEISMLEMKAAEMGKDKVFLNRCIDKLSAFMEQENRTYNSHSAAILNWAMTAVMEDDRKTGKADDDRTPHFTPVIYDN